MSKAAMYAGFGQGLMALGQGVSRAVETMTIEQLRQQNLQQNWARQDALQKQQFERQDAQRAEDIAYRKEQDEIANNQRQQQIDIQSNRGLMGGVKPDWQKVTETDQFGNDITTGWQDPNSGRFVPVHGSAKLDDAQKYTPDQLEQQNDVKSKQQEAQKSQFIEMSNMQLLDNYKSRGLTESDAQAVSRQIYNDRMKISQMSDAEADKYVEGLVVKHLGGKASNALDARAGENDRQKLRQDRINNMERVY